MFNDLNNNKQNQAPVDDIFAETDKTSSAPLGNTSEISAQKVGLEAEENSAVREDEASVSGSSDKWFKIIIILIIVLILALGAYLAYRKYNNYAPAPVEVPTPVNNELIPTDNIPATSTTEVPAENMDVNQDATNTDLTPIDVVNDNGDITNNDVPTTTEPVVAVDSDSDGLTDAEEAAFGINPLVADTDGDGLGDYEEVKIYRTNPLNPDTDGDGYADGAEVKAGYNPNGLGQLPGFDQPVQ